MIAAAIGGKIAYSGPRCQRGAVTLIPERRPAIVRLEHHPDTPNGRLAVEYIRATSRSTEYALSNRLLRF